MAALMRRSASAVCEALQEDPEAAKWPFFDHALEPVLVCAVRYSCGTDIINILLDHGADVNVVDIMGRSPLAMLVLTPSRSPFLEATDGSGQGASETLRKRKVAARLLAAGADPEKPDRKGCIPIRLALCSGETALADELQHYHTSLAQRLLRKGINSLNADIMPSVFGFLVPDGEVATI